MTRDTPSLSCMASTRALVCTHSDYVVTSEYTGSRIPQSTASLCASMAQVMKHVTVVLPRIKAGQGFRECLAFLRRLVVRARTGHTPFVQSQPVIGLPV